MLNVDQRDTFKAAPNYLRDELLWKIVDEGTREIIRIFADLKRLGAD